jgi:hypothetical protein
MRKPIASSSDPSSALSPRLICAIPPRSAYISRKKRPVPPKSPRPAVSDKITTYKSIFKVPGKRTRRTDLALLLEAAGPLPHLIPRRRRYAAGYYAEEKLSRAAVSAQEREVERVEEKEERVEEKEERVEEKEERVEEKEERVEEKPRNRGCAGVVRRYAGKGMEDFKGPYLITLPI